MSFNDLNTMMKDAIENLKNMLEADSVVGTPVVAQGGITVIPISRLSVGFITGGYDMKSRTVKQNGNDEQPVAAIGGGVSVTPLGFLVISQDCATFIKTQGDAQDKWLDIIQSTIKTAVKS